MTRRPVQDIRIWKLQHRPTKRKAWGVRWVFDGQPFDTWFPTHAEADRYRSRLLLARTDGDRFDRRSGEPESWSPAADEMQLHVWARKYLAEEWATWAPRTRQSQVEALARFVPLVIDPKASDPPSGLRRHLVATLTPTVEVDPADPIERWLDRWTLSLGELDSENLAEVDRRLGLGDQGQTLARSTAGRYRQISHCCVRRAVELKRLSTDPWPVTPRGRSRRKASRKKRTTVVDVKRLPAPTTMLALVAAMRSHQPGSRNYQEMSAVTFIAGLRPSEVAMLRVEVLYLPDTGWGWIDVVDADDGWDEPAEPKTGPRRVPIPPILVARLRAWIAERDLGPGDLLFRTSGGKRPSQSNWGRCIRRACRLIGIRSLSPYDGRHACATAMIRSGVSLGDAAERLGHSVETLVATYIGALEGDDLIANQRMDATWHAAEAEVTAAAVTRGPDLLLVTPYGASARQHSRMGVTQAPDQGLHGEATSPS